MATWSARIAADADDALWWSGGYTTNIGVTIGNTGAANNNFLRYINVTVPKNATINSAKLTLRSNGAYANNTVNARIRAVAEDNPAAPTTFADANGRTRTSASANWPAIPAWTNGNDYDTPDFAAVVQEIVNRSGWASGNAMLLYIEDNGTTGLSWRTAYSYYLNSSLSPLLTIDYTEGSTFQAAWARGSNVLLQPGLAR